MNRAERRAAARAKPALPPRRRLGGPNRPMLAEVHHAFAPLVWMFDELRRGEVSELGGAAALRDVDGEWYQVGPALVGWCELWERLSEHYRLALDTAPVRLLAERLAEGGALTLAEIDAAWAAVDCARRAYQQMDVYEVKSFVRTLQIRFELERAGREGQ